MKLSTEESASGQLNPGTLEFAIQQVKVNGYVIFESVLPAGFVRELHDAYIEVFERYLKDPDPTFGKNHYRVYLPFRPPFNDERIIANPLALPILDTLLGQDFVCHYFASNTCAPGSEFQPAHSDIFPLFPHHDVKPPAYHVVLNIPLVDTTEESGPVELWPGGSHWNTLPREQIEKLSKVMPAQPALMPAGSILLRDGRMWHRGTRNLSGHVRPNLALVYTRSWLDVTGRIGIPQEIYDGLSDRARMIFREERIGDPLDTEFSHRMWQKR